MRILYHHRTRAGDAQGIHIAEIQRAFRARGHEVLEVALVEAGAEARADGEGGAGSGLTRLASAAAARLPLAAREAMEVAYNAVAYRRLARAVRDFKPDFIYERYAANTFAGLLAARRHGVPLVVEINSPLAREKAEHGGLRFARLTRAIERRVAAGADVTIAVSSALARILEQEVGVPSGRIVVIPNGVRRGFGADPGVVAAAAAVRRRLGVAHGEVLAGFIGWFRPWHGLESLVEAAGSDAWREAGIRLALAGDGPAMPALRAAARRLDGRVILCGTVPRGEVAATLAAFDIAVQPAVTPWACPMKVLEYMAAGRAIVAPGAENVRELLTDGETALLCPGGAVPAAANLSARVLELARDPALRVRLGEAARARIFERGYLWEENARRVEELVARLGGAALAADTAGTASTASAAEARPC